MIDLAELLGNAAGIALCWWADMPLLAAGFAILLAWNSLRLGR